jgi:hypothetical protein
MGLREDIWAGVASRHRLTGLHRFYQRAIRSEEL